MKIFAIDVYAADLVDAAGGQNRVEQIAVQRRGGTSARLRR
jgi:hypothetical protein